MKKLFLSVLLILAASSLARAQVQPVQATLNSVSTGACTPTSCLVYTVPNGVGGASISLTGTSGTATFETVDVNGNYATLNVTPSNSSTAVTTSSPSGNSQYQVNVAGFYQIRVRLTSAGSIAAIITPSTASARAGGGGSSFNPAAPGPIGATTPSTGTFTSVTIPSDGVHAQGTNWVCNSTPAVIGSGMGWESYVGSCTPGNFDLPAALPTSPSLMQFAAGSGNHSVNTLVSPAFVSQTDAATVTWAIGGVLIQNANLTFTTHGGSRTLNLTGLVNGGSYVLWLKQDATGGEGLTLGTGCTWKVSGGGAGAITPSVAANAVDVLAFTYDGTNCYANFNKNFN